jgi:cell division protease FtsH
MSEKIKVTDQNDAGTMKFEPLSSQYALSFSDIGGMNALKKLANLKIIQPFKKPELFKRFNKSAGGGILLYGPPGCGKSYFARAVAGECQAHFYHITIDQVLDMYQGNSEQNIKALFETVRADRPAVIFFDEIDALGKKRSHIRHSGLSTTINAFLSQFDGVESDNEDILIIGATNAPWDVDPAFRRTGRFDQTLFIPPPDQQARTEIFSLLLNGLPVEAIEVEALAKITNHYSGADIKGVVDRAGDSVISEIIASGNERSITHDDLWTQIEQSHATTLEWLQSAKNVVEYANQGGSYDPLADYLESMEGSKRRIGFY